MHRLVACSVCLRHVRLGDARCPFCEAPAPTSAPPIRSVQRARAAALGFSLATAACGGTSRSDEANTSTSSQGGEPGSLAAEPPDDDHGASVAEYGAPSD